MAEGGDMVTPDVLSDDEAQCSWCYEIGPKDEMHNLPEGWLCDDCFTELYR